ncbi:hypothetical protein Cadr_000028087 [Camelus dromedarius]|uniref:Uncharacterized protein n=1 Tax=Camelus dromedarius TaxID=9838 RepID=A0A5N4C9C4_CAMDR|nr:hypothetical protein Cadr_000028087 [Camelus dromedarius]
MGHRIQHLGGTTGDKGREWQEWVSGVPTGRVGAALQVAGGRDRGFAPEQSKLRGSPRQEGWMERKRRVQAQAQACSCLTDGTSAREGRTGESWLRRGGRTRGVWPTRLEQAGWQCERTTVGPELEWESGSAVRTGLEDLSDFALVETGTSFWDKPLTSGENWTELNRAAADSPWGPQLQWELARARQHRWHPGEETNSSLELALTLDCEQSSRHLALQVVGACLARIFGCSPSSHPRAPCPRTRTAGRGLVSVFHRHVGLGGCQLQLSAAPRETASALKVRSKLTMFKGLGPLMALHAVWPVLPWSLPELMGVKAPLSSSENGGDGSWLTVTVRLPVLRRLQGRRRSFLLLGLLTAPELLVHPVIPHGDQAFFASTDDFPVVHLDSRDSELVGRDGQGDRVSAEVMEPHPGGPKVSTEISVKARNDKFLLNCAGLTNKPAALSLTLCSTGGTPALGAGHGEGS